MMIIRQPDSCASYQDAEGDLSITKLSLIFWFFDFFAFCLMSSECLCLFFFNLNFEFFPLFIYIFFYTCYQGSNMRFFLFVCLKHRYTHHIWQEVPLGLPELPPCSDPPMLSTPDSWGNGTCHTPHREIAGSQRGSWGGREGHCRYNTYLLLVFSAICLFCF